MPDAINPARAIADRAIPARAINLAPARDLKTAERVKTPADIAEAAQQFETLLIGQLLKASSDPAALTGSGESDAAGTTALEMAQEQFAAALSARGGLGLARMITTALAPAAVAPAAPSQAPAAVTNSVAKTLPDSR
ncbi:MAG: hypothetical protein H7039_04775 [Bryobacteraceae bacterium]|nr:hypothetical protein [Bryobacteraceae bacterium]